MKLAALSFVVGLLSSGIGVGGGALMVPAFTSAFRFDFRKAAATSLAIMIPISFAGAMGHILIAGHRPPALHFLIFAPSCVFGSIAAGNYLSRFRPRHLKTAFALFLAVAGIRMTGLYDPSGALFSAFRDLHPWALPLVESLFGVAAGFTASMLGVGCGLVIVPFFVIVAGLDIHTAIALSLSTIFVLSLTATIVHKRRRSACAGSVGAAIPAALIGAAAGVLTSQRLPSHTLKLIFGALLLVMSAKYLFEEWIRPLLPAKISRADSEAGSRVKDSIQ